MKYMHWIRQHGVVLNLYGGLSHVQALETTWNEAEIASLQPLLIVLPNVSLFHYISKITWYSIHNVVHID